jgi:hypothetical protein
MRTARRRHLGLLIAVLALPACATTTRSVTGLVPSAPGGSGASGGGRPAASIRLSLDENLRAEVRADDVAPEGDAVPALVLRLVFDPKVLGYAFAPGQLVLRDGRGGEWRPTSASAGRMSQGACTDPTTGASDAIARFVPLVPGSCAYVGFDRPVRPGEPLELVIGGAALGQRRLEPVTVALARTEQKSRRPAPAVADAGRGVGKVLQVALTILLAPLAMAGGM